MKKLVELLTYELEVAFEKAGYDKQYARVTLSNRPDLCEYQCNGAMAAAKAYRKAPIMIANDVVAALEGSSCVEKVEAVAPGFINMILDAEFVASFLKEMAGEEKLGVGTPEYVKTIVVDYGGANVAKALHVGHLRPAIIGESVKRIGRYVGHKVIGDVHLGDWGSQMGLVMMELKKRQPELPYFDEAFEGEYPEESPFTIEELGEIYPTASAYAKEHEDFKEEALQATYLLQNGHKGYTALWRHIMNVSLPDLKKNYSALNVEFDLWKGEADAKPYIADMVEYLKKEGYAHEDQGALVVDVKEETDTKEIPPCMILKSDGAALYATTDLATLVEREKLYQPDQVIYVTDKRQEMHFEQVFRCAKKTGIVRGETELIHIGFGTMNGKDGKPFKTRDGGVMTLKGLIELVTDDIAKRINKEMVEEKDILETSKNIAIATLKYTDLLPFRTTDYIFEVEKFSDFEGKTGPYLLYSTIRMNSLLEKAKNTPYNKINLLETKTEKEIAHILLRLPIILSKSLEIKSLNDISEYIYKLTALYNKFYSENKILTEKNEVLKESRLVLTKLVYDTNMFLLDILGITVPKKM